MRDEESIDPAMAPGIPPRRRRLRGISLRVSLVLVAVAALGLAWMTYRIRLQQEGIALVRNNVGMYYYDYEFVGGQPWAPDWVIRLLGIDAFHHVTWVRIEGPDFDDADLAQLMACLPRIESLGIIGTMITDEGLASLRGNRRLKGLFLGNSRITDAGIDALDPMSVPALTLLDVRGTGVSAARAAEVQELLAAWNAEAKLAQPGVRIGDYGVLTGELHTPMFFDTSTPRADYERERAAAPVE